jgi:hypothetical protein
MLAEDTRLFAIAKEPSTVGWLGLAAILSPFDIFAAFAKFDELELVGAMAELL